MKTKLHTACIFAPIVAMLLGLMSCGGNQDQPATSCDVVISGFMGNLNADYPGGNGGEGGDGNGDGGGVGGGAGLGKVLGAAVRVISLVDKRLIGEAVTDVSTGLFTVRTCHSPEPLLITLKGTAQAKYYDEGKNELVEFGPEHELHVLVDQLDENIGVSAFTEAAYRYVINHPSNSKSSPLLPLRRTLPESELQLTVQQIREANAKVMDEVNRILPAPYQLQSIKSLPTPIDANDLDSPTGAISTVGRYGQATVITGAFAWMAAQFNRNTTRPVLDAIENFARDMTDGVLNGFALDGQPASLNSEGPAYDSTTLPFSLTVGANTIADLFNAIYLQNAPPYVDFNGFRYELQCATLSDAYALSRTGALSVRRTQFNELCIEIDNSTVVFDNFGAHEDTSVRIKQLYSLQWTGGGTLVYSNGDVRAWGNNDCGQLGNGKTSGMEMVPVPVPGLRNITSMASGYGFSIARDDRGIAYSWGGEGVLGLGESYVVTCAHSRPTAIPGLANIVTVYAAGGRAFAIDRSGYLYAWGHDCGGEPGRELTPVRRDDLGPVVSMAANEHGCFVLKNDGTLLGWGFGRGVWLDGKAYDGVKYFGDGQDVPRLSPTLLSGLTDIREIASDNDAFYALDGKGRVWRWGGGDSQRVTFATTPTRVSVLGIEGVIEFRHIESHITGAHLFAKDGKVYAVKDWGDSLGFIEVGDLGFN